MDMKNENIIAEKKKENVTQKSEKKPFVEPEIEVIRFDGKDFISMVDNSKETEIVLD